MQPGAPYIAHAPGTEEPVGAAPAGILFLRIYCGCQVLLFSLLMLMGLFFVIAPLVDPTIFPTKPGDPPIWLIGAIMSALYFPLLVVYSVGLAAPRRRWMYAYGIAVCALSMTCGGCWPMAIPALIYWLKPELKTWLGA